MKTSGRMPGKAFMALRKVVLENDPLLRKKSREVADITDRIRTLIEDMWETMYESNGVGLAAPQVGVLRRVVVIDVTEPVQEYEDEETSEDEDNDKDIIEQLPAPEPEIIKYVLINPEVIEVSEELETTREGCLSVPGQYGMVERPVSVKVRAIDLEGQSFVVEGDGMLARALLHEIDHLDGVLYTDIAESLAEVETECEEQI